MGRECKGGIGMQRGKWETAGTVLRAIAEGARAVYWSIRLGSWLE